MKSSAKLNIEEYTVISLVFQVWVSLKHTLTQYADHLANWTAVGARLSKQLFLNLHSLEEDIIEKVRERMESGKLRATFRDFYYVSTAKEKSWQQAHRIEERRKETGYARNVVTQDEYEKVLARARVRMGQVLFHKDF